MILRTLPPSQPRVSTSETRPTSFPGLVSSLRPIKRVSSQLAEEATLLRRFTYKNKNQHKAQGWWKKTVEVDRITGRVTVEIGALLESFGVAGTKDKDLTVKADGETIRDGLLRLPRAMLVVEKSIQVMLKAAGILEQLVSSRAFLSFALVLVSLVARLHALASVLRDELGRCVLVWGKLVAADAGVADVAFATRIQQLPKELRRFLLPIVSDSPPQQRDASQQVENHSYFGAAPPSSASSARATPTLPEAMTVDRPSVHGDTDSGTAQDDELGARISREDLLRRLKKGSKRGDGERVEAASEGRETAGVEASTQATTTDEGDHAPTRDMARVHHDHDEDEVRGQARRRRKLAAPELERTEFDRGDSPRRKKLKKKEFVSMEPSDARVDRQAMSIKKKRSATRHSGDNDHTAGKDEIDDIFG